MIDHLIKEVTECIYCHCKTKDKKWSSEWNEEHHYKTFICDRCKRKNHVKVDFHGSGHDSWDGIEKRVE
ncbi:hypothetical protein KY320_00095 [Candidatus Woesearchaeota archaeon]|nr:hypothetical protein [Candidatus Woesearchaeota archaeon]